MGLQAFACFQAGARNSTKHAPWHPYHQVRSCTHVDRRKQRTNRAFHRKRLLVVGNRDEDQRWKLQSKDCSAATRGRPGREACGASARPHGSCATSHARAGGPSSPRGRCRLRCDRKHSGVRGLEPRLSHKRCRLFDDDPVTRTPASSHLEFCSYWQAKSHRLRWLLVLVQDCGRRLYPATAPGYLPDAG